MFAWCCLDFSSRLNGWPHPDTSTKQNGLKPETRHRRRTGQDAQRIYSRCTKEQRAADTKLRKVEASQGSLTPTPLHRIARSAQRAHGTRLSRRRRWCPRRCRDTPGMVKQNASARLSVSMRKGTTLFKELVNVLVVGSQEYRSSSTYPRLCGKKRERVPSDREKVR